MEDNTALRIYQQMCILLLFFFSVSRVTPNISSVLVKSLLEKAVWCHHADIPKQYLFGLLCDFYWFWIQLLATAQNKDTCIKTISSLETIIILETLWFNFCLWGIFSLSGGVLLLNGLCLFFSCVWIVSSCTYEGFDMSETHVGLPSVSWNWMGDFLHIRSAALWCFLLHCDVLHSVGSALIMSKYDACGGRVDETDSCHYLSVHICMFVNPADIKIKLLQLLSHVLMATLFDMNWSPPDTGRLCFEWFEINTSS